MVFYPPKWVPQMPFDPPDSCTVADFMFGEQYKRVPYGKSLPAFTCGLTGKQIEASEMPTRVDHLASGLAQEFGWAPNQGSEWDKVVNIFSLNTIDYMSVAWAAHRLNGIATPANAAYGLEELIHQLKSSGAKCIFTNVVLLDTALKAAETVGIPHKHIYILELPEAITGAKKTLSEFKTVDQLIEVGKKIGAPEKLRWKKGQGAKQVAFLCYSSGTSGLPKGVMISHRNVIANVTQASTYDDKFRKDCAKDAGIPLFRDVVIGLLPFSHIYALVLICHTSTWRGDQVIVLPKFEQKSFFESIQHYGITALYLVPPIIIMMVNNKQLVKQYNLSSVLHIFTGAAPLGKETASEIQEMFPSWKIRQGYGMTESATLTTSTSPHDIDSGSCGSLIPGVRARIVTIEGNEITGYDQPGELLISSPSVTLGYLNNDKANAETFQDGWLRTGDEAVVRLSPQGNEHIWIVDRIKELIKVKGLQVAPAELEAHLLAHPAVADCTVIPVPDDRAGEVPKAFVVKAQGAAIEDGDRVLIRDIKRHVEKSKARHKWLDGGVEFVDEIPKSPSGKILRRMLRDKEREKRRKAGAKL